MNILRGEIESITEKNSLSLVGIRVNGVHLTAIVIDTPETAPYLKSGHAINAIFKETEVIIGKGTDHQISLRNKFPGKIISIESGDLLSKIVVQSSVGPIVSVITTNAVNQLHLTTGSEVTAMIKTNEIMLST